MSKDQENAFSAQQPAPLCSVCIANYNGIALIDACIASVLEQECSFSYEIIVHDDASTDDSVRYIKEKYPRITLLESTDNAGFCISNNRMAAVARGEYILLLNNDAVLYPDALASLRAAADNLDRPAILSLPQFDARTGLLIDIGSRLDPFLNPVPNRDKSSDRIGMVSGACLWINRSLWHELGGFPDWFGSIAEDTYVCCVARLHGYTVKVLPNSGFRHWVGKSLGGGKIVENQLRSNAARRALSERNKNFVMAMVYPAPAAYPLLFVHVLLLLAEGCVLALLKRDRTILNFIYLASIRALWDNRRTLLQQRAKIQTRRRLGSRAFFSVFQWFPHKLALLRAHGVPDIK